jgi:plasmid stabilization system protein ParE
MTIRQVEIHPDALAEAEAAIAWYADRSSRAPAAFIEEIDRAIQSILSARNAGLSLSQIFGGYPVPISILYRVPREIKRSRADPGRRPWQAKPWLLEDAESLG